MLTERACIVSLFLLPLSFPKSLLMCPQLVTWHFSPILFLPMTCLYFSRCPEQFGLPGNSLLLGFSWEYLKTLENTECKSFQNCIPKPAPRYLPRQCQGFSHFLRGHFPYPISVCNFEGKPFDKCLQLDFTLGQECDFL